MRKLVFLLFFAFPVFAEIKGSSLIWESESVTDDFTDETKTMALITAEGGVDKGFIHFMCTASGFEGKVGAGAYVGDKEITGNVKFRVDKFEAKSITMNPTSKTYVYFNDAESPFIASLLNGKESVLVQVTSYDYDSSKAKFSLKGAKAAISKVVNACKKK